MSTCGIKDHFDHGESKESINTCFSFYYQKENPNMVKRSDPLDNELKEPLNTKSKNIPNDPNDLRGLLDLSSHYRILEHAMNVKSDLGTI